MDLIKQKILFILKETNEPYNYLTLAKEIDENPDTVRARLSEMYREGLVFKWNKGVYAIKPSHGLGSLGESYKSRGVRIQNLRVVGSADVLVHDVVRREWPSIVKDGYGKITIEVVFGAKRGQISWWLAAPLGIDYLGFTVCRGLVDEICRSRGFEGVQWEVRNVEVFNDFLGQRLEGLSCVTMDFFDSTIVKIYQREGGVRHEIRSSRVFSIEDLVYLFNGGAASYLTARDINEIRKLFYDLITAVKFLNEKINSIDSSIEKIFAFFHKSSVNEVK
jgi:hypothetical protein